MPTTTESAHAFWTDTTIFTFVLQLLKSNLNGMQIFLHHWYAYFLMTCNTLLASFLSLCSLCDMTWNHREIPTYEIWSRANSHIFICLLTFLSLLKAIRNLQFTMQRLISMQSISHVWLAIFIKSFAVSCVEVFLWPVCVDIEKICLQLNVISHIDAC